MSDDTSIPAFKGATLEFTILMASLMSVVAISIDAFLPALGTVGRDLKLSNPNHAQFLIGFIFLGMSLGELVAGPLSDALGRKKVLYIGIGFYLLGSLVCLFASTLECMMAGRLLQGLGVAGPYVCTMSIVRDKYSGRHMARVMSVVMTIFIMVPAIAPSLGQAILFYASWRAIFAMYIVYSLLITAWLFFRLEETLPPENRIPFRGASIMHGLREIAGNRQTLGYTLCIGTCFGGFLGYLSSCQQIFQDQFGVGSMFPVYFGCLALMFGASSLLNARLVEKLGMRYLCRCSFAAVTAVSAFFLGVHFLTEIHLWMLLVYVAVIFFSFGLAFGNLNALAMEPMGHIAGIASAIISAGSSLISMGMGSFIGQMYDNTLIPIVSGFLVCGILSILVMGWTESWFSRGKRDGKLKQAFAEE